eukprot:CAMPEP_0174713720 /NCGR_PEP_ID=MMETSP1094-20130205/14298_1 /TAXON_ID=156173 /ORGANISM="Chrysochromulina brevifilum, Strain UTEX LB 985" /LENGTH=83 /DNA_ID=CAMNT_0015912921 /DNA_START=39 /DNA_END=288 /DNA_ORIENTATION=-
MKARSSIDRLGGASSPSDTPGSAQCHTSEGACTERSYCRKSRHSSLVMLGKAYHRERLAQGTASGATGMLPLGVAGSEEPSPP